MRRIRLAGVGSSLRCKPGADVGDLLISKWLCRVSAPVGHPSVGQPGDDDRAQILVADKGKIRWVDDRAEPAGAGLGIPRRSFAAGSVATGAKSREGFFAAGRVA